MESARTFTVTAPASSGNLGPGFDVFGLALDLRNALVVRPGSGVLTISGEGEGTLPTDETNLVARSFEQAAGMSIEHAGVDIECHNRIPLARGLGSSTAAAACGLVAGWEHAGTEWTEDQLCDELVRLDGHPDNAGACAYGGVVLCHDRPAVLEYVAGLDVIPLGAADWLQLIALVPDRELATEQSRTVVPSEFAREDVVRALGGAALLAAGLVGGHVELLEDALHTDVLHEPYRADLVPELQETREALATSRALGATLSGAGPTVLVWCDLEGVDQVEATLAIEYPEMTQLRLTCAHEGVVVLDID